MFYYYKKMIIKFTKNHKVSGKYNMSQSREVCLFMFFYDIRRRKRLETRVER